MLVHIAANLRNHTVDGQIVLALETSLIGLFHRTVLFAGKFLRDFAQVSAQHALIHRFEKIILHTILHRRLSVGEFTVGADNNNLTVLLFLSQISNQLDSVHVGHFQIGDNHIILIFSLQFQRLQTIACSSRDLESVVTPVDQVLHALTHNRSIIHN